ncbi:DUF4358 domain-containing protein [Peptostreptococcus equinus]|uniref:DUF4358 domain-containing protein n=1 Tax=Peptostreptococcus equinus TaxID=3003601 RepID=A0ABY7JPL7_9FIRM|nr:DUF4358 domain-containing protein [Peptostreptococcus sp. CBA3647]WAW14841.1 DUF4358 domain-containing protein [Peptostreptococcus sp. CBA3647]
MNNNNDDKKKEKAKKESNTSNFEQTARLRIITSEEIEHTRKGKDDEINPFRNFVKRKPLKTSSIYRKKYAILWVVVFLVFVLAYQFVKVKEINFSELSTQIENNVSMDELQKGDESTLRKLYGIDRTDIEKFCSYAPKSNMIASEILVIKAKPEAVQSIVNKIQVRIDSQSNSFKNYAPDQYSIISQSQLKVKGDYIYYISAKNMNKIDEAIKASYK